MNLIKCYDEEEEEKENYDSIETDKYVRPSSVKPVTKEKEPEVYFRGSLAQQLFGSSGKE